MSDQPNMQPMRERLTKLFEFLKAYTDLRFPPVRDIAQEPRSLLLNDLPAHSSVELFRDTGKSEEEVEDSDIVLRLTRPITPQLVSAKGPGVRTFDWGARTRECIENFLIYECLVLTDTEINNKAGAKSSPKWSADYCRKKHGRVGFHSVPEKGFPTLSDSDQGRSVQPIR